MPVKYEYIVTWEQKNGSINTPSGDGWEYVAFSSAASGEQSDFNAYACILWRRPIPFSEATNET